MHVLKRCLILLWLLSTIRKCLTTWWKGSIQRNTMLISLPFAWSRLLLCLTKSWGRRSLTQKPLDLKSREVAGNATYIRVYANKCVHVYFYCHWYWIIMWKSIVLKKKNWLNPTMHIYFLLGQLFIFWWDAVHSITAPSVYLENLNVTCTDQYEWKGLHFLSL